MVEQRPDVRPGRVTRTFDVFFDICLHCLVACFELRRRGDSQLRQTFGAALEGAPLHPALDLLARSISAVELIIEVRANMLAPTVGHAFEKKRPGTRTQIL